ncbi:hypothetical protein V5F41_11035 [Xanthobacter autotrophicus]|uniref:hypothetical protein n=1 Tax=Xanthobacter autotrophicus TaxID=280 RepID=UPI003729365A
MALARRWAGRAFGTNTGNLFIKIEGDDAALSGLLHFNELGAGIAIYNIQGTFDGHQLKIIGEPQDTVEGHALGKLTAIANLNTKGELKGEWDTSIGTAGTFILYPHDQGQEIDSSQTGAPDQLHTARHNFGAIEIIRDQIINIAEDIQKEFKNASLIVTVVSGTEQSRFLNDFKLQKFNSEKISVIKLFIQQPEDGGINRVAQIEFGQQVNFAMIQGGDEAWVLGTLEKIKRSVRPLERTYTTKFKKLGFGINQLLLIGSIVYLPSLNSLQDRAILMSGIFAIIFTVDWLHVRYLPFSAIYLSQKPKGVFTRFAPSLMSWLIAATAGIAATLLAAYLQGLSPGH